MKSCIIKNIQLLDEDETVKVLDVYLDCIQFLKKFKYSQETQFLEAIMRLISSNLKQFLLLFHSDFII